MRFAAAPVRVAVASRRWVRLRASRLVRLRETGPLTVLTEAPAISLELRMAGGRLLRGRWILAVVATVGEMIVSP
jgi:hypothetical protein